MSSILQIVSDHNLSFSSGEELIRKVELALGKKILRKTISEQSPSCNNLEEIEYYHGNLELEYTSYKSIFIRSNFQYCSAFRVNAHTLKFDTNCLYYEWSNNLINHSPESKISRQRTHEFSQHNWPPVREYAKILAKLLGGKKVVYISSDRFQIEQDLLEEFPLVDFINALTSLAKPFDINQLKHINNVKEVWAGWYYENIP